MQHLRGAGIHFWALKSPIPCASLGSAGSSQMGIRLWSSLLSWDQEYPPKPCSRMWQMPLLALQLVEIHPHFPFCMEDKANKLFHRMFFIYLTHPTNFLELSKYIFIISWAFLYNYHRLLVPLTASFRAALIYKIISFGCLLLPIKTCYEPG